MANRFLNNISINDQYTLPASDGSANQVLATNGSGQLSFVDQSGGASLSGGAANKLAIWSGTDTLTNDTNLHWDTSNDRLGIGTPNPNYALHVNGQIYSESSTYPVYYLKRNTSATGGSFSTLTGIASAFKLETDSSGTITDGFGGGIVFSIGDTFPNTAARIYARRDGGDQTGALQFWGGVDGETVLMTLRASSNVGIGTVSPAEKLDITDGKLRFTNTTSSRNSTIGMDDNYNFFIKNTSAGNLYIGNGTTTFVTGNLSVDSGVFYVDASNDKVGIGTASPSFPLEVNGGTGDGVKIKAGNTSNDDSFLIANSSDTTLFVVDGAGNINLTDGAKIGVNGGETLIIGKITGSGAASLTLSTNTTATGGFTIDNTSGFKFGSTSGANTLLANTSSTFIFGKNGGGTADYQFSSNVGDVTFLNSGDVGIGTNSPSQKLDVNGNVTANRYYGNSSTQYYLDPNDSATSAVLNGNVAIGDFATPAHRLVIRTPGGSGSGADGIFIKSPFAGGPPVTGDQDPFLSLGCSDATDSVSTIFMGEDATATSQETKIEYSHNTGTLGIYKSQMGAYREHVRFGNIGSTSTPRTRFYGNVGIGIDPSAPLHVSGVARASDGFTSDGLGKLYAWRAVDNTVGNSTNYVKIARLTGTASGNDYYSDRCIIELAGRSSSYSNNALPAMGYIVAQLQSDANWDVVYYNHHNGSDEVVDEVGVVQINTTQADIYVRVGAYAEVTASGHISDGSITVFNTRSGSAPSGYSAANAEYKVWNSGNDGSGSTLDADLLDGQHGSHYLNYNNLTNKPTIPTNYLRDDAFDSGIGLYLQGGSFNAGTDTVTAPLVIDEEDFIYSKDGGYLRKLLGKTSDQIQIGQGGTSLISSINFLPGTAGNSAVKINGNTVWNAGNDGPGSGLAADTVDDYHANRFFRRIHKATATVGPGWMTVAENVSGRRAGEIVVTDADGGDHAYIRIEWMRSYSDSNFTVLNCGGHSNRITGARVLYETSNNTYGTKKLQVYVTTSSNYEVNIYEQGDIDDYDTHSVVTPVIQNTISGYALHGNQLENLDTFGFAAEEGILAGGDLAVMGNQTFGIPGNGSNTSGRWLSFEGNTDSNGEGSGRLFFSEHNSSTTDMDDYGMSIGYRGGNTSVTTTGGNTWTGLSAIGNGEWGMWGHDNSLAGTLIMAGPRTGNYVKISQSGGIRAQIFYDLNSTSYYVNPASNSKLYQLSMFGHSINSGQVMLVPDKTSYSSGGGFTNMTYRKLNSSLSYTPETVVSFQWNTSQKGSIGMNAYGTQFNTSSDYRLKENAVILTDGIQRVKQLQPKRFNFIGFADQTLDGFLAHEVSDIVPEAVTGEKDAVDENNDPVHQVIDQSKIVPLLTAALKEAISKIEDLETRIQILENQ